ncbi:MAG: hypothetical protein ACOH1Y_16575 [Propionicimonas sp.]
MTKKLRSTNAEGHTVQVNPGAGDVRLNALRTVMLYTITDVFALVVEESMWAGYHLDRILAPLMEQKPRMVPLPVRQEMLNGAYSRELNDLETRVAGMVAIGQDPSTTSADLNDWAGVLVDAIGQMYQLRPMEESALQGQIIGLLRELGVGDPTSPRGSRYLPTVVRHRLMARS